MYKAETFTRPLSVDPAAGCGRPSVPASADGMSNCSFAEMLGGKEAQWTVAKRQAVLLCFRSRRACSQFCTGDGNLTPGPGPMLTCYCMMAWWPSSLRLTPSTDSAGIQGQRPSSLSAWGAGSPSCPFPHFRSLHPSSGTEEAGVRSPGHLAELSSGYESHVTMVLQKQE